MGLFDKVRNTNKDDDEIELRDPQARPRGDPGQHISRGRRDKLRDAVSGEENEVELRDTDRDRHSQDRSARRENTSSSSSHSDGESEDKFLLPGMAPAKDDEPGQAEDRSTRQSSDPISGTVDEKMDRVLEQNKQIISLLEDIAEQAEDDGSSSAW